MHEIDLAILENMYATFVAFIEEKDNKPFFSFATSGYFDFQENYKYFIRRDGIKQLAYDTWNEDLIGFGEITKCLITAFKTRSHLTFYEDSKFPPQTMTNNLVNQQYDVSSFAEIGANKEIEEAAWALYRGNDIRYHEHIFEVFVTNGVKYRLIAFLFFLQNPHKYLPIASARFDQIFKYPCLLDFKTSGRCSWDNYSTFIGIIHQVHRFLVDKVPTATLIDAHSFLWMFGNQMLEEN